MSVPSRRSVLAAGVWSVPAVSLATTAPAFAASGVGDFRAYLPQVGMTRDTRHQAVYGYLPAGAGEIVTMTLSRSPGQYDLDAADDQTYDVVADTVLGTGPAVVLHQQATPTGMTSPSDGVYRTHAVVHTLTFSAPVRNLSFAVGGLVTAQQDDGSGGRRAAMSDGVDVEPAPSSEVPGTAVARIADADFGSGVIPGFWYGTSTTATPESYVAYTFNGPLTQLTLRHIAYSRYPGGSGAVVQRITLSGVTFDVTLPTV